MCIASAFANTVRHRSSSVGDGRRKSQRHSLRSRTFISPSDRCRIPAYPTLAVFSCRPPNPHSFYAILGMQSALEPLAASPPIRIRGLHEAFRLTQSRDGEEPTVPNIHVRKRIFPISARGRRYVIEHAPQFVSTILSTVNLFWLFHVKRWSRLAS